MEMRGTRRQEFVDYFLSQGGEDQGDGKFKGPFWDVKIGPQESIGLGAVELPSVKLSFSVEEDKWESFLSTFWMKFLRGGG